jgi:Xaa-Pro dipeptidase
MYPQRLERLQKVLQDRQIDCLAVVPGANMRYLTGIDFHLMERPTVLFIPAQSQPLFVLPTLERSRVETAGLYEARLCNYSDDEGPDEAFRKGIASLPEIQRYAVEHLRMRLLEFNLVRRQLPAAALEDAGPVMDRLRLTKTAEEIAAMRAAIAITESALKEVVETLEPGMTERQIASRLTIAQFERGGGVLPFEAIVSIGSNAALPHGTPGDRALLPGQPLLIDFGTSYDGYISDLTRTFFYAEAPSARAREIYEVVKAANAAGRAAAGPGVPCQEVDRAARQVIEQAGYGPYFTHRVGHGIGMEGHEGPYMKEGNTLLLEPGMTFTVEPGIYLVDDVGVRIEDNVVITPDGAETLTTFDRELRIVGAAAH